MTGLAKQLAEVVKVVGLDNPRYAISGGNLADKIVKDAKFAEFDPRVVADAMQDMIMSGRHNQLGDRAAKTLLKEIQAGTNSAQDLLSKTLGKVSDLAKAVDPAAPESPRHFVGKNLKPASRVSEVRPTPKPTVAPKTDGLLQTFGKLDTVDKVSVGMTFTFAAMSMLGAFTSLTHAIGTDEHGEKKLQLGQVGAAIVQGLLGAGLLYMGANGLQQARSAMQATPGR